MTLVCTTPCFKFSTNEEDWPEYAFVALLMRHGKPPKGFKWYGKKERLHVTDAEAKEYAEKLVADIRGAIDQSRFLSHYSDRYVQIYALNMKNKYMRWWREYSRDR